MREYIKEIKLDKSKVELVDDEDFDRINQYRWGATLNGNYYYAVRKPSRSLGKRSPIYMHREILGIVGSKIQSDHIDHNGLNNQKSNLRTCSHSQNNANRKKHKEMSSIFKGVSKKGNSWRVQLKKNGNNIHYKTFGCELIAALDYDDAARKHHGKFACTNF